MNVLDAYSRGVLREVDLVHWAEALYGRDDVGFISGYVQLLNEALFELSNSQLFGPTEDVVSSIRARLGR